MTSLGSLFQCSTTLSVNSFFLISNIGGFSKLSGSKGHWSLSSFPGEHQYGHKEVGIALFGSVLWAPVLETLQELAHSELEKRCCQMYYSGKLN